MKIIFWMILFFCGGASAEVRTWHNEAGKAVEAELLKVDGDLITLRLDNGKPAEVKLSAFCAEDQEYVKTWEVDLLGRDWNVFGYDRPSGNELEVTFYDLKVKKDGTFTAVGENLYEKNSSVKSLKDFESIINRFQSSGWKQNDFDEYYSAPLKRYASALMTPYERSTICPKSFGVADKVEACYWATYYTGNIRPLESGKYRFCGQGDDVLLVKINGEIVLDASLDLKTWSSWKSDEKESGIYSLRLYKNASGDNNGIVYGDWIQMEAKNKYLIEILFCDSYTSVLGGGRCFGVVFVEQEGKEYKTVEIEESGGNKYVSGSTQTRKLLPVFCTAPITPEQSKAMGVRDDECVVDSPLFEVVVE